MEGQHPIPDPKDETVSENDERDPQETLSRSKPDAPIEPMSAFEAFRARQEAERTANEPFPAEYLADPATGQPEAVETDYSADPTGSYQVIGPYEAAGRYDDPLGYSAAYPAGPGAPDGPRPPRRARLRSVTVFALVIIIAGGIGAGIYAVVPSSSSSAGQPAAAVPASTGTPASVSTPRAKPARMVTARVTVLAVGGDSFSAQTAAGQSVTVVIGAHTKFGTAARPFSRAQLVPGAKLIVRGARSGPDGITATVLAGMTAVTTPDAGLPAA
jgi:hypothetical protein